MVRPALIVAAPFILLIAILNSPLRESFIADRAPASVPATPAMADYNEARMADYEAREQAARERRIEAAEARAARELQEDDAWARSRDTDWAQVTGGARRNAPARPQMGARAWASQITGALDSPMEPIQAQLAESGVSPSLSRQGNYRVFTYRFRDGSVLEFTAVPAGGQTGLILHSVDIRD